MTTLHSRHQCQPISGLLEVLAVPSKLPADLVKEEKDINGLLDKLIEELQSLKKRHKAHVERHISGARRYTGLLQRLLQGEQLQSKEATGDAIAKMITEAKQVGAIKSPYCVVGDQLRKELRTAGAIAQNLLTHVEQLWVPKQVVLKSIEKPVVNPQEVVQLPSVFRFSSKMKHQDIILSDNNTRARGTGYDLPLVVVKPSVNTPCRALFKINSINSNGFVFVGVCIPSVFAKNGYEFEGSSQTICSIIQQQPARYLHDR